MSSRGSRGGRRCRAGWTLGRSGPGDAAPALWTRVAVGVGDVFAGGGPFRSAGALANQRGGRYHNRRYEQLAGELGLAVTQHHSLGWAITALAGGTAERYAQQLEAIDGALRLWRRAEARAGTGAGGTALMACQCACGRRLRASRTVIDEAPIVCGRCGEAFVG